MRINRVREFNVKHPTLAKVAATLITIVLLAILLSQVNVADVVTTLLRINPFYLAVGFVLYTCSYFFRAVRFHVLLNREVRLRDLFWIVCVHNMMNNLLPARTGELSYVYLLKRIHARPVGEGIATLVVARVFDSIAIIFLLFAAGSFVQEISGGISDFLWIIYIFLLFLMILLIVLVPFGRRVMWIVERILKYCRLSTTNFGDYILRRGHEAIDSFERIEVRKNVIPISILSISTGLVSFGALYLILLGMGITLPIQNVIFGATFILLASVLPFHGIAGFGTTEAIWTVVYIPLGMTMNDAIISGFGYHILILLFTLILGLLGSLALKWKSGTF